MTNNDALSPEQAGDESAKQEEKALARAELKKEYKEELDKERKKASFNKRDLSHVIYDGKEGF